MRFGGIFVAAVMAAAFHGASAQDSAFRESASKANEVYEPIVEANGELLKQGKVAEATKALLDAVPEKERTAGHWFVLGNLLFSQDFATSYACHEKAAKLAPAEPMVLLEYALERHRKGEHAEAEKLYSTVIAAYPDDSKLHALRADCLLRIGKHADAVAEWKASDIREHHSSIEESFSWVYGKPHPVVKRGELLAKARGGDVGAVDELVLLDLEWETDWWNSRPKADYLAVDLELAAEKLAKEPARLAALRFLAKWTPKDELDDLGGDFKEKLRNGGEKPAPDDMVEELKSVGILGEKPALPPNSRVAGNVLQRAVSKHAATPEQLLASFEAEYRRRVDGGDAQALESLSALYEETKNEEKVVALEKLGWEKLGDRNSVRAVLGRRAVTLRSDDPVLIAAVAKFPDDERITALAGAIAVREKKGVLEAVVRLLEAQLSCLVSAYPANATFKRLEDLVAPKK